MTNLPVLDSEADILDCGHMAIKTFTVTGYGWNISGQRICYSCCGKLDRLEMINNGKMLLYLGPENVVNWPGTLQFHWVNKREGRHNIAGIQTHVDFIGPDGHWWHGVQYGYNTQIIHCKRTKDDGPIKQRIKRLNREIAARSIT